MPHPGILFMRLIAPLPLSWIRGLGAVLGWVLYPLVAPRRKVVLTNLALCFPERSEAERQSLARQSFVYFAQSFLDRAWLVFYILAATGINFIPVALGEGLSWYILLHTLVLGARFAWRLWRDYWQRDLRTVEAPYRTTVSLFCG